MKRLTEGAHQTRKDLIVINEVLHFREQLFTAVGCAKHVHCLLDVGGKFRESSRWKHVILIKIEDVASKKFGLQIF